MGNLKNYYKVLELSAFADAETVKAAYRKLARQNHPDLHPGNKTQEEKFKLINEAYDTLGSPEKKNLYDESLRILLNGQKPRSGSGTSNHQAPPKSSSPPPPPPSAAKEKKPSPPPASSETPGESTPINELFENFVKKGFGKEETSPKSGPKSPPKSTRKTGPQEEPIFRTGGKPHGEQSRATGTPKRGQDVTVETVITPREAQEGVVKTVHVQHTELCKRCSGTGKVSGGVCTACHGEKAQTRLKKIDVRVPAGVKQGSKVRVAGEGGRGQGGAENGDLFLNIKIEVDASLKVDGMDVYGEIAISIPDAVLGREIDVPTLHGVVKMTIPPLTSSGKVLRLKDQGVHNGQLKGDHFVTIRMVAPAALTAEEKSLYERLGRLQNRD